MECVDKLKFNVSLLTFILINISFSSFVTTIFYRNSYLLLCFRTFFVQRRRKGFLRGIHLLCIIIVKSLSSVLMKNDGVNVQWNATQHEVSQAIAIQRLRSETRAHPQLIADIEFNYCSVK